MGSQQNNRQKLKEAFDLAREASVNTTQEVYQAFRNGLISLDDATQAMVRDNILRLPNDGTRLADDAPMRFVRETLGSTVHHARHGYGDTIYKARDVDADIGGLLAGRALQAGGLTAAGVGLANLTHQYQNSFGGPADSQPMTEDQYLY